MISVTLRCLILLAFATFSFSLIFFFAIWFLCVSIKIVLYEPHSLFIIKSFILPPIFFDQDAIIFTSPTYITVLPTVFSTGDCPGSLFSPGWIRYSSCTSCSLAVFQCLEYKCLQVFCFNCWYFIAIILGTKGMQTSRNNVILLPVICYIYFFATEVSMSVSTWDVNSFLSSFPLCFPPSCLEESIWSQTPGFPRIWYPACLPIAIAFSLSAFQSWFSFPSRS